MLVIAEYFRPFVKSGSEVCKMDLFDVLTLIGGLCLFLFGMNVMGEALESRAGNKLRTLLSKMTTGKFAGFLTGLGVTAIIQSSSATTVMVVGFVNSGLMNLRQAIHVILGANIGTTVTGWLLSLGGISGDNFWVRLMKPSSFVPVLALVGIILYMFTGSSKKKDTGAIFLGFATLMFGMEAMSGAVSGLSEVPAFRELFIMFTNPILGLLAGTILTCIIQSSSASVGILQALSMTGQITFGAAIPIVMGDAIGTCITAILSAIGAKKNAKRAAAVHLYFNLIGTVLFLCLFYLGNAIFRFPFTNDVVNAADIALVHSIFNVFTTLVLLPFTKGLEKLAYLTIPKTEDEKKTADDVFVILDDRFLSSPAFAIEQCRSLVSQMAEMTRDGFLEAMDVLGAYSEEKAQDVIDKENRVDVYDDKITAYLTKLSSENLSYKDSLQVTSLLHCITDFERISDHSINVVESVQQMRKENLTFSRKGEEEMNLYGAAIRDILTRTTDAFVNNDQALAHTVEPLEEVIDELNKDVKKHHMKRLRKGKCSMELGLILSDLAMNYERVADHCSNIAVYMMQLKDTQLEEHSFTEQLDEAESAEFTRLLDEFGSRYSL